MLVAVTGGAGFLGAHVVRSLLESGASVQVLVRPGGDRTNLDGLSVDVVEGDLAAGPLPAAFARGAVAVAHCAAVYSERPEAADLLLRVNVEGTRAVLDAAAQRGVQRVVHVSTMGTCAPTASGRPATEADRVVVGPDTSAYARSKVQAEDLALARRDLEVVVVNPAAPVGAFDRKPTVTGQRILDILRRRYPRLLHGPTNYVPARGCARGIVQALRSGRPGERYLLGGENLAPGDFLRRVAAAARVRAARRSLLVRLRELHAPSPRHLAIDDRKARTELGYAPGSLDEAFAEAAAWFWAAGLA